MIDNARIVNSVIRRDAVIESGAMIEESIIMDHTVVGKGCRLRRVIIDKFNVLPEGTQIGIDPERDRRTGNYHHAAGGIVVVPKAERDPRGVCAR